MRKMLSTIRKLMLVVVSACEKLSDQHLFNSKNHTKTKEQRPVHNIKVNMPEGPSYDVPKNRQLFHNFNTISIYVCLFAGGGFIECTTLILPVIFLSALDSQMSLRWMRTRSRMPIRFSCSRVSEFMVRNLRAPYPYTEVGIYIYISG